MQPQDEWLLTDGLGGFAMGTRDGVPRRRYHGLCMASMAPPCGGEPFFALLVAEVVAHDEKPPLWQATFAPHGVLSPPMHVPNRHTARTNSTARWRLHCSGGLLSCGVVGHRWQNACHSSFLIKAQRPGHGSVKNCRRKGGAMLPCTSRVVAITITDKQPSCGCINTLRQPK